MYVYIQYMYKIVMYTWFYHSACYSVCMVKYILHMRMCMYMHVACTLYVLYTQIHA